jgi:peptidoglycan hydrolase-like protein with peptidoglycan-binding domain
MRKLRFGNIGAAVVVALFTSFGTAQVSTAAPLASSASVSAQVATAAPAVATEALAVATEVPAVATVETVSLAASTSAVSAFTCYSHNVVLTLGSRGECVKTFQRWNNRWGVYNWHAPRLVVDGQYGYATYHAAGMAQKVLGLVPDGVLGHLSWNRLTYALG